MKKSVGRLLDATSRKDEVQSFPTGRLEDKGVLCLYQQEGRQSNTATSCGNDCMAYIL